MADHQRDPLTRRPKRPLLVLSYLILGGAAWTVILLGMWVVSGSGTWWTAATWVIRALYALFFVLLAAAFRVRLQRVRGRHAPRGRL